MNEDELKAIWQKEVNPLLEKFDFDAVKQKALKSQEKLRRRMRWEFVFGILLYISMIPIFIIIPRSLFLIPLLIPLWIWYIWETRRIYQLESDIQTFDNFREFLRRKQSFLRGYIKRTRLAYFAIPIVYAGIFLIILPFEMFLNYPYQMIGLIVVSQIIAMVFIEINFRLVYTSPLDEIEDLLRQLDETQ